MTRAFGGLLRESLLRERARLSSRGGADVERNEMTGERRQKKASPAKFISLSVVAHILLYSPPRNPGSFEINPRPPLPASSWYIARKGISVVDSRAHGWYPILLLAIELIIPLFPVPPSLFHLGLQPPTPLIEFSSLASCFLCHDGGVAATLESSSSSPCWFLFEPHRVRL